MSVFVCARVRVCVWVGESSGGRGLGRGGGRGGGIYQGRVQYVRVFSWEEDRYLVATRNRSRAVSNILLLSAIFFW